MTDEVQVVEGEVLPPAEPTYSERRLALHNREALFQPYDLGVTATQYPTVTAIVHQEGNNEPTYTFTGKFWDVFKDVFNLACQRVHINNRQKGFWPDDTDDKGKLRLALYPDTHGRNVGEALALMDSENGEALDAFRTGGLQQKDDKLPHRSGLFTEISDTIIRGMDFLGGMMAEGGSIIVEKLTFNKEQRGQLHGKQF